MKELIAWIGCQNCGETRKMSYVEWEESLDKRACPVGASLHHAKCAKRIFSKISE